MKQADCLRMALAELPQGTMEIVGRPAAEPGVLFTGTFQGETDGRGRMEVYPVFPGVEASFNTGPGHLCRLPARGGPVHAGDQPLPPGPGGLGPAGRHVGLSGGGRSVPPQCGLLRGFCDALPGGDVRGADDLRGFDPSGGVAAPHLGGGGLPGREAGGKILRRRDLRPSGGTGAGGDLPAPVPGSRRCGGCPISG